MRYTLGIDFGTLSARGVLIDADSGSLVREVTYEYDHGVMDRALPCGKPLPQDFALQHPGDYVNALSFFAGNLTECERTALKGIGIDFTSSTLLPIDGKGDPLCLCERFIDEPHAYVKLWKHHGAEREAEEVTAALRELDGERLSLYGGKISCEWAIPKILETLRAAPDVFESADAFIEAGDYISGLLTGNRTAALSFVGYKWLYVNGKGYPDNSFFEALDPRLSGIVGDKICNDIIDHTTNAGTVSREASERFGLPEGIAVATPTIDAHAAMPALNIMREGEIMLVLGTSGCHILNSRKKADIRGTAGYVYGAILPDLYTYEAGQASFGDNFDWFVSSSVPEVYTREATDRGISVHKLLRERAAKLRPGQSGLIAIDWLNGNRSILIDPRLCGAVIGITLATKPEEIYRAHIEAAVYGSRVILETYEQAGVSIGRITAAGGIASKDEMMMQIFADVLGRDIYIAGSSQAGALGSAIFAAAAAGIYKDPTDAAEKLSAPPSKVYHPIPENVIAYDSLYTEYKRLHDYFGKENTVMHKLKDMRAGK